MSGWGRMGERRIKFQEDLRANRLTLDEVENKLHEYLGSKHCEYCSGALHDLEVERIPYNDFLIHRFKCTHCENEFARFYSSLGTEIRDSSGLGTRFSPRGEIVATDCGFDYVLRYALPPYSSGSPIRTSRDYKDRKTGAVGRPQKHDYKKLDHRIWEYLSLGWRTKYGLDTAHIWRNVNFAYQENYSRALILRRLKDLSLRGLVKGRRRKFGLTWKWFWQRIPFGALPHNFYVYPQHAEKFTDRGLFPEDTGEEYWEARKKAEAAERRKTQSTNTIT